MREETNSDQSHDTASHKARPMQNKHSGKRGQENCSKCFMASEITRDAAKSNSRNTVIFKQWKL